MEAILTIFFIIVVLLAFSAIVPLPTQKAQISPSVETPPAGQAETPKTETPQTATPKAVSQPTSTSKPVATPSQPKPTTTPSLIDTYITSGPKEGELINETTQVEFEFKAQILSPNIQGQITFETKLEGFDNQWISTYSNKRMFFLPPGPKEYTFLVRAKVGNIIDQTPATRTFKINTSPYFGKVRIVSVQPRSSTSSSLITLSTSLQQGEKIKLTGWQLKGKGGSFLIIKGVEKYHPIYTTFPDEIIYIEMGDVIYLSGASNPLGEELNFRPNKCFGYLSYKYFPISVPQSCPKPTQEEISFLDPCCQEFIRKTNLCEPIDYTLSFDRDCKAYLKKNFNYNGCFENYSEDEDFTLNQWHIYLNRDIVITDNCDTLYLLDRDGRLVDKYTYGQASCRW